MKLDISHLTRKYGAVVALDDLTITFTEGVYGILGANGAGKSTLMNLLTDNISQKRAGYMFRIVGDQFEEGFSLVKDDISLEDVYLYYVAR